MDRAYKIILEPAEVETRVAYMIINADEDEDIDEDNAADWFDSIVSEYDGYEIDDWFEVALDSFNHNGTNVWTCN